MIFSPRVVAVALLCCLQASAAACAGEGWRVGVAAQTITPKEPMWMAGYGSRNAPATGKLSELSAKALVIEDKNDNLGIVLTLDLVGIDRSLSRRIVAAISQRLNTKPENIVISTSHTHSGPVVGKNLGAMHYYQLSEPYRKQIDAYEAELFEKCVKVAAAASERLTACKITWGVGSADFATNRRNNKEPEVPQLRAEGKLAGPYDHDVPVLAAHDAEGKLLAVLFGYACHSTVLSTNVWSADYPGYAQEELERRHPGCIALFFAGCGADQNPLPRRTVELAKHYGQRLATAVDEVLLTTVMHAAQPELKCVYTEVPLPLASLPTVEQLKQQQSATNKSEATRAKLLLEQIEAGQPLSKSYPYPISLWRIGDDLNFIALGGEVVVDFALLIKADLGAPSWIAGYAHDVMAYIPSRRVLAEGGYEGGGAMVYYGLPAPWAPEVEETIMRQVTQLAEQVE